MSDESVDFNLEELKELIKLLRESGVSEFELCKADYRLRIKQGVLVEESVKAAMITPVNGEQKLLEEAALPAVATPVEEEQEAVHEIRSPIVGTFYRSSNAGSDPFIEAGDVVKKGQVLCIIEAMKMMNEIESDLDGEIRQIHVENGQPVEFGELLFSIKVS
jgi:acetyl-CoA carboxylase biotin carboxyl carrier protein